MSRKNYVFVPSISFKRFADFTENLRQIAREKPTPCSTRLINCQKGVPKPNKNSNQKHVRVILHAKRRNPVGTLNEPILNPPCASREGFKKPVALLNITGRTEKEIEEMLRKNDDKDIQKIVEDAKAVGMDVFAKYEDTGLPANSFQNPNLSTKSAIEAIKGCEEIILESENNLGSVAVLNLLNLNEYRENTRGSTRLLKIRIPDLINNFTHESHHEYNHSGKT